MMTTFGVFSADRAAKAVSQSVKKEKRLMAGSSEDVLMHVD
jgi:hypothetical protein